MFIAGIDGGGTHTRVELRDMDNQLLRRGEFGAFNINSIGAEAFAQLLREVFDWCGDMRECSHLCVGAAGVSNPRSKEVLLQELSKAGFDGKWIFCGDQEIALRGAMDGSGIVVIAGTGSICFGKNDAGQTARSGGFGHLIDDGGSGYALGRDVISCAVRCTDGRVVNSGILQSVCERIGGAEKIVPFVYSPETDKSAIAQFSTVALEQAAKGDLEAQKILHSGAEELALMVKAVQERLDMLQCRIALLGGLISSDNPYRRIVSERLGHLGTIVSAQHDALWGAAQMAWEIN